MVRTTFGMKIREGRKKLGLNQDEFAERIGVKKRAVAAYESDGKYPRNQTTIENIASLFGVTREYLFNDQDSFIQKAEEEFGESGRKDAITLTGKITGLFAGGELEEVDMDAMMSAIEDAYVKAKKSAKKYTPMKYREDGGTVSEDQI